MRGNSVKRITGTLSYLDAGGEQTIYEYTENTKCVLGGVWLDLSNMTQNGTATFYYKVDGTNYRKAPPQAFVVGSLEAYPLGPYESGLSSGWKITYTESGDEGAARDIPYEVLLEV